MAAGRSHSGDHRPLAALRPLRGARAGVDFTARHPDGSAGDRRRAVAIETPVAVEVGGVGYAVMMATPADLVDFATGFCLAERLVDAAEEVLEVEEIASPPGILLRVTLADARVARVHDRVRHRTSESSCGLCGIESLGQALRTLPRVSAESAAAPVALFAALSAIRAVQPLNAATGSVHAAALCSATGEVRLLREDVGRHNAFDKLVGAMRRGAIGWDGGFALLTARCSYELVEKAALANCPMLATISMATSLALERAAAAGLKLVVLARPDAYLEA